MIGNGIPISQFGGVPTLTLSNTKVMEGIVFSVRKRFIFAAGAVVNLVFNPVAFTGKVLVIVPISFDSIGGPFDIDVIPGVTDDDDGTPIMIFNRNFQGAAPKSVMQQDPNNLVDGPATPREIFLPSDGQGAVGASGASGADPLVINFDPTKKLLFRFTNTDGAAAAKLGFKFDFFEAP